MKNYFKKYTFDESELQAQQIIDVRACRMKEVAKKTWFLTTTEMSVYLKVKVQTKVMAMSA